ncbi:cytochrome P450 [Altererythrobacter arenosus]|uniref:Cytochrome P450 n=1 Tax=Altererythrobacter arenosus TaxID=3032592 RepID=A0ABY8FWH8_9SPHN|nr:cytochrome P450 [Altererythrobacter sp. CAU 1644]WFL77571.1 cytochrome P450 [Altererythrobacter sp. CAU 1644]
MQAQSIPDPYSLALEDIDVSEAELFETGAHHRYFKRLRDEAPVHFSKTGPTGPFWSITKHADIMSVDTNHRVFSSKGNIGVGDQPEFFQPTNFIQKDPPEHDEQRVAVAPAVKPQQLSQLESMIRERIGSLLDQLPVNEEFDWVDKVSIELTTQMLATLFDFPWEDRRLLPYWSDVATATEAFSNTSLGEEKRQQIVLTEMLPYFTKLWHERAAQPPKFDFLSLLAHNPKTKNLIDDPLDFLGNIGLLIVGGNDTTRNSMSASVHLLNEFPDQFAKLKSDPSLIPNMVSEVIRWQTPLAHMRRTATEDIIFQGQKIKKGDRVVMWYVSGNRDEEVFENADDFIIDRPNARRHVSFGFGIHRCMGNRVAEMQLRILWEEILERFDRIEVLAEPKRVPSSIVMGIETLPVRLVAKEAQ